MPIIGKVHYLWDRGPHYMQILISLANGLIYKANDSKKFEIRKSPPNDTSKIVHPPSRHVQKFSPVFDQKIKSAHNTHKHEKTVLGTLTKSKNPPLAACPKHFAPLEACTKCFAPPPSRRVQNVSPPMWCGPHPINNEPSLSRIITAN